MKSLAPLLAAFLAAAGPAAAFDWYSGDGSDGSRTVTANPDNEDSVKTNVSGAVSAGAFSIPVGASAGFNVGDLVLLIQMTGAGAGGYEFRRLSGTTGGPDSLIVSKGVSNAYGATGAQVIKVREYGQVTVLSGGSWSASAWNGTTGGVFVAVVRGSVTVAFGGEISLQGKGFRGAPTAVGSGGTRGEGETGATFPTGFGGSANGVGGGGGGGQAGCFTATGGGGGGGLAVSGNNGTGLGLGSGGGTAGGATLESSLFPGGGGGAGGANTAASPAGDGNGGAGGAGGGIVLLVAAGDISVAGTVKVNGAPGSGGGGGGGSACFTAGGGGGAGGSVRLVSTMTVAMGSGLVTALPAGAGVGQNGGGNGGSGGGGRIAVLAAAAVSGSANPAANSLSGDGVTADDPFTTPGAVSTLAAKTLYGGLDVSSFTVRLTWTAPGADSSSTTLNKSTFTVRYGLTPIAGEVAYSAAPYELTFTTHGVEPGSTQTVEVGPLDPTVTWYFVLKTTDAWGNTSALSVSATAQARQTSLTVTAQNTYDVAWADLDSDGDLDAFTANMGGENARRLTQDAGSFFTVGIAAGSDGTGLAWGDFDKDGDPDLLVGNGFSGTAENKLLVNLGGGGFLNQNMPGAFAKTLGVAWADLDHDGDLDGVAAVDGGRVLAYRNDGNGFSVVTLTGADERNIAVVPGDFDGDGRIDLAVATEDAVSGDDYVLYNDGGFSFTKSLLPSSNPYGRGIAAGDVDGDGDLDLVLACSGASNEQVFKNNGNRSFASPVAVGTVGASERVRLGDYDNDGDLDAVVTNIEGTNNKLLRNSGTGSFTAVDLPKGAGVRSRGVSFGDYDVDGDLDLLIGNDNAEPEYLVRNDTGTPNAAPVPPGPDQHSVILSYAKTGSTLTFAWLAGSFDGAAATTSLNYDIAVSTYPLDLTAGATGFLPSVNSFVVPPSHHIPGFGHHPRPGYKDWTGEGFPFHAVQVSSRGAATQSALQWNTTYYLRVQTIDAGLARSTWGAQRQFYLPDPCAENHSLQSGRWANPDTWATGLVPLACTPVRIHPGHTVRVDITTATASTTTVSGSLLFSNTAHSSLTLVGGSLFVQSGGLLEMGGPAGGGAIPSSVRAHLLLAYGSSAGEYGLVVQPGGNLRVQGGSDKPPFGYALESIAAGANTFKISASSAANWAVGDALVIGRPGSPGAVAVEQRTITGLAGTDPLTVTVDSAMGARVVTSTSLVPVANLTRNVVIRSSGTNVNTNAAYLWALPTHTTGFLVQQGEFAYLGSGTAGLWEKSGVYLASGTKASVSSSTFHHGWYGLAFDGAGSTFTAGVAAANLSRGVSFGNYAYASLSSASIAIGNQNTGFETASSTRHVLTGVVSANNSGYGVDMDGGTRLEGAVVLANNGNGAYLSGAFPQAGAPVVRASLLGGNGGDGVRVTGGKAVLMDNRAYANTGDGFDVGGGGAQVLSSTAAANGGYGFRLTGGPHLAGGNAAYANSQSGFFADASSSVFVENHSYSNSRLGFDVASGSPTWAGGALGRDAALTPAPNSVGAAGADTATPGKNARLQGTWFSGAFALSNLVFEGDSFVSFGHDHATGTVRVLGDYVVERTTLTLGYSQLSHRASTSSALALVGSGHTVNVLTVSDADAVSQVVTIEFRGGQWHMDGSVSGPDMRTWIGHEIGGSAPAGTPQFTFDFFQGGVQSEGDRVSFAVLASAKDSAVQKRLLFESMNGAFNSGKSRLRVAAGAGLELRGAAGFPTVLDRLNGSATYYTLVASGAFTAERSSISNVDGNGLQLVLQSPDGDVFMATTTFDSMGIGPATGAYVTLSGFDMTSSATFYGLTFGTSRSTAPLAAAYNIRHVGAGPFPAWTLRRWSGFMGGERHDGEPFGDAFKWAPFRPGEPGVSTFTAVTTHSITSVWTDGGNDEGTIYEVQANTYAFANEGLHATFTYTGLTVPVGGLSPNTSYFLRVFGALQPGPDPWDLEFSPELAFPATATLAVAPSTKTPSFLTVLTTAVTVGWHALPPAPASHSAYGYRIEATSGVFDANYFNYSSATLSIAQSTLTVGRPGEFLEANTTYSFRVASLNEYGAPSYLFVGTTATLAGLVTPNFNGVFVTSVSVTWAAPPASPQSGANHGYVLEASTTSFGTLAPGGLVSSSATAVLSVGTLTVSGLTPDVTYYFRLATLNVDGAPNYTATGATVTSRYGRVWFGAAGQYGKPSWGDYDQDGDLDAAVPVYSGNSLVMRNDGGGAFTDVVLPGGAGSSVQALWLDVDGDGDLDILLSNIGGENERLLRNAGGSFTSETVASGANSRAVAAGDFDGDGDLDVLVANEGGLEARLLRNAGGVLVPEVLAGSGSNFWGVAAGDFDSDGDLDAVLTGPGNTTLARNAGGGTFSFEGVAALGGDDAQAVDLDGDGDQDVVVARGNTAAMKGFVNDGSGAFTTFDVPDTNPGYNLHTAWADTDRDGDFDALLSQAGLLQNTLRNDGGFAFRSATMTATVGNAVGVAWADVDGDRDLDGFVAYNGQTRLILRDDLNVPDSTPTAPGAPDFHLAYDARSATLTVTWAGGAFDAESSSALVNYALTVTTAPMTLSPDGLRVVSPSSAVVAWNRDVALAARPAFKVWPGEAVARHGRVFRLDLGGVLAGHFKSDATYYVRLAAIDGGLSRSSWGVEASTYVFRALAPADRLVTGVSTHSLSVSFTTTSASVHLVEASTAADFTGDLARFANADAGASSATLASLAPNTTYFVRVGALWQSATSFATAVPASTATDAALPVTAVSTFAVVDSASMTVVWGANGNPLGITTYTVVLTTSNFYPTSGTMTVTATTAPAAGPGATLFGLRDLTTYYLFVRAVGHSGTASPYTALGSTVTGPDFEPPAAVTGLRVSSAALAGRFVDLEWSAPGDDGVFNPLDSAEYRVDYATYAAVFSTQAAEVSQSTTGVTPGERQALRVTGLDGGSTYFFRVFARDNSGNWSGLSNGATVHLAWSAETLSAGGRTVSAVAARDGSLNLLYQSGSNLAHLRRNAAGTWTGPFTAGVGAGAGAEFSAGAADAQGRIHAVYADGASLENVRYAVWDGVWGSPETVFSGAGGTTWSVSVAVDAAGGVHAAWNNTAASPHVRYSSRSAGGTWSAPTGLADSGNTRKVDLRLEADGRPVVAYTNSAGRLRVARWDGAGFASGVVDDGLAVDGPAAFALGLDGRAAFVLKTLGSNAVEVVTGTVAGAWTSAGADLLTANSVLYPALLFDGAGAARALYHQSEAAQSQTGVGDLRLAAHDGGAWRPSVIDRAGGGGANSQFPGLAVDAAGILHAGYLDGSGGPVRHASFTAYALAIPGDVLPPDAFRADAVHATSVTWAWTDSHPSEAGYRVYGGTAAPYALVAGTATLGVGAQAHAETSLIPNTTYFRYAAVVTAGGAGVSVGVTTVTLAVEPTAAASTWTAVSTGVVSAAWESGGNSTGTRYEAVLSSEPLPNAHSGNVVVATAPQGSPGAVFAGLGANATYYLAVRAVSHAGLATPYVALGSTFTAPGIPEASTAPFAAVWLTSMTVHWSSGVNPAWTEYRVELASSSDFGGTLTAGSWEAFTSTTLVGLTRDTTYWARVTARGLSGVLSAPLTLGATATLAAEPAAAAAPFPVVAVSSLTAAWEGGGNPSDTLYQAVVSTVNAVPDGGADEHLVGTRAAAGADIPGLQANSTHYLFVRALNRAGTPTAWAAVGSTPTLAAAPGGAAATFTAVGQTSMTLSWTAGLNPAGTLYLARASTSTGFDGAGDLLSGLLTGLTTSFAGLAADTTYHFRIAARGHSGQFSAPHDPGSKATSAFEPAASTAPFHSVGVTSATVQWQSGGNPAGTLYRAEASTAADFSGSLLDSAWVAFLSTTVTGLTGDATYYWRVRARNVGGVETAYLSLGSTPTAASDPLAAAFGSVGPASIRAEWGAGGNREADGTGAWSARTALPTARERHAAVQVNGRIYVVGGLVAGSPSSEVWSAATTRPGLVGSWRREADLPAPREAHALVAYAGRLYAVGGFDGSAKTSVYSADLSTGGGAAAWRTEASLPAARFKLAAAAHGGWLYAVGGDNGVVSQATVYRAPISSDGRVDSWATATAMPAARNSHAAAVSGGRLYVSGGLGAGVEEEVWSAPLAGASVGPWTVQTPLPGPVFRHAMTAGGGALVVVGGHDGNAALTQVLSAPLSPAGAVGAWTQLGSMPLPRFGHGVVVETSNLFVVGGANDSTAVADVLQAALGGTQYNLEWAQDGAFVTAYGSSNWRAGSGAEVPGLTPNSTYHLRLRSRARSGLEGAPVVIGSTLTPAAQPGSAASTFSLVEAGSMTLTWTGAGNPAGTEFLAALSTSADFTAYLTTNWTTSVSSAIHGLTPNTSYFAAVLARDSAARETRELPLGSTVTAAAVPTSPIFPTVATTGLTVEWSTAANPAQTRYEADLSAAASFTPLTASSVTLSSGAQFGNLLSATTYYLRVRALNRLGIPTAYSVAIQTVTGADFSAPAPVTGLGLHATDSSGVLLAAWTAPGDDGSAGVLPAGSRYYLQWTTGDPALVAWSTAAAQLAPSTGPVNPGAESGILVTGVTVGASVYARVWTADESGNVSAPSSTAAVWASPFALARLDGSGQDAGRWVSVAVDRAGDAHAAYTAGTISQELRYLKRAGGVWSVAEAPDPGIQAEEVVLAVGHDVPQAVYRNSSTGQLRFARRSAGWVTGAVASGDLHPGGLAVDATGLAHVSYYDAVLPGLRYARGDGASWTLSTVEAGAGLGRHSSLALGADSTPHIAYYDAANGDLKYASRTAAGVWQTSTVDPAAVDVGSSPVLALDGDGHASVFYLDAAAKDLKWARFDGTVWTVGKVDSTRAVTAVGGAALDGAGRAAVTYLDGTDGDLHLARFNGAAWDMGGVDSRGDVGAWSALAVEADGGLLVLHYDATGSDLKSATWAAGLTAPLGGNPRGRAQAPASLGAVVASSTTIQWTWTDSATSELGWRLYGGPSSTGPFSVVAGTTALPASAGTGTQRVYTETGLTEGTTYFRYVAAVSSGGFVVSPTTAVYPYSTADLTAPTISNLAAGGDLSWRRAVGTLYNVDFGDAGGSALSKFQVKASTVALGAGPDLVAYTDVVIGILSDSYTADWALPSAFFTGLMNAATNYVSIRVIDGNGNAATLTDAFKVLKDTAAPTLSDNQGDDPVRRAASGTAYDVDAFDAGSGLERFQYSVSTAAGSADGGAVAWTDVALPGGATFYQADWTLAFAGLLGDATNYVSVRAWDRAGSTASLTDAFSVVKDTGGPRVAVLQPSAAIRSVLSVLSGTAADAAGVGGAQVAIQSAPSSGNWYDGAGFTSGTLVWLAAAGTTSWTFSGVPAWVDGGAYRVVARASDTLGNFSVAYSTADFSFDASTPTAVVTTPVSGTTISVLAALLGTAADGGPSPSGLSLIEVRVRRAADGLYWNWLADAWGSVSVATTPAVTSPWSVPIPPALAANLAHGASYFVSVSAADNAVPANTSSQVAGSTFAWSDTTPPAAITDLTALTGESPGDLALAWTAPGDDGAAGETAFGQYRIHYATSSGAVFSTSAAQVAFSTANVKPGARHGRLISGLSAGTTYYVRVFFSDDAGNWSALSSGATAFAGVQPFQKITGHVVKTSSEGITAVLLEAYDANDLRVATAFSLADGSGSYSLEGVVSGAFRVQASWTAGDVTSSVWLDNVEVGSFNVDFVLEINYTLSTLTGTLAALSAQAAEPHGFMTRAAEGNFSDARVELQRGGVTVAAVRPNPTGRWSISNLLPGKYAVRAFNGLDYTEAQPVELGEGETQEVVFVFDPLPEASVFAFPNPARSKTTFRFVSALPGLEAQVTVFDIAGTLVRELPGSAFVPKGGGLYHADWDLTNDDGESVASGVYLFMAKVKGSNGQSGKVIKKLAVVR